MFSTMSSVQFPNPIQPPSYIICFLHIIVEYIFFIFFLVHIFVVSSVHITIFFLLIFLFPFFNYKNVADIFNISIKIYNKILICSIRSKMLK